MMINDVIDSLDRPYTTSENDYVKDGLVYCGKCHTPKQTRFEFRGKTQIRYCMCQCEIDAQEKELNQWEQTQRADRIRHLRSMGFPDAEMSRWTFDKDDSTNEKLSTISRKFVENFAEMCKRNKGLLLYGQVGRGKSFYASCIANALIDQGIPCLVTNFARLVNTISGMYDGKQDYIDGLSRFELLVIDDLAAERDTEYMSEMVYNIIDARYRSGKPLIVTANLTAEEIANPADIKRNRILSRLYEMCVPIEVKGEDKRKHNLTDNTDIKRLLGM